MRSLKLLLAAIAGLVAAGFITYYYFTRDLPALVTLEDYHPNLVTNVYSEDGRIIGEFYIERRVVVPLNKVPQHLITAFLAAEDTKFFEHEGISYTSILRAMFKNMMAGKVVQGGSTITQQLAKSFLTSERKLSRKVREAILAYRIEKHLTKDEILTLYLNQIYFGNGAYGVQTAAESYFGKDVNELDLAEAALLAGLPKAPSKYSPYSNFELAKKRQEFVLSRMVEEQFITKEDAARALGKKIKLRPRKADSLGIAPYFTENVRIYLEEKYGEELLYKGGLEVYTTVDVEMQKAANIAVREGLRDYDKRHGYRGPVTTLKTKDEIDTFRDEADKRLQYEPLKEGEIYKGVITAVNPKNLALIIDIGNRHGIISAPDLEWAKLYNPTKDPDGGKEADIAKIFHSGDVVEVMVKDVPSSPSILIPLKLEQEPAAQASLLAMEPETGAIRAMIGGADFSKSQFNRAVQSLRQPGSSFKPIIYTAAMDKNYTPASIVIDSPLVFDEAAKDKEKEEQWRPRNYDEQFNGPTTIREAVARSRNIITIKVLQDIGIDHAISYARLLGINSPLARDLSLALGSSAVTLQEMTTAFSTLANLGERPEPLYITRVTDRSGKVLEENTPFSTSVISPQTAYIMTSLLQSVIERGTGLRARALGRPAAGKTGTTNNLNDAWFIGYVPGLTAGAWLGYDEERQLGRGETGGHAALPIWLKFMQGATAGMPVRSFPVPEGVEFAKIDPETGLLATTSTQDPVFEVFKAGTAPVESSAGTNKSRSDFFMVDTDSKPKTRKPELSEPVD
ncbi:MAG: PBP1A family penicillin-binding protein [Deltaproteobacteria bacterium]|nr:PBP1A family penicillin-binding protein [Deltaproteobacteria bacterium]